ncbi:MAG: ABC transporter permease [Cytophagaceae bacterium]
MNKIMLIIQREYITRIRKKSFVILSLLGPLLFAIVLIVPLWFAMPKTEQKMIFVSDHSGEVAGKLQSGAGILFGQHQSHREGIEQAGLLMIPQNYSEKNAQIRLMLTASLTEAERKYIQNQIDRLVLIKRLERAGVDNSILVQSKPEIELTVATLPAKRSSAAEVVSLLSAVLVYFFIFLYGVQVMRGVIEEKANRIVEVIISSVRPFQLMMGKIIGIALVSLTQFVIWLTLTFSLGYWLKQRFQLQRFTDENIGETLKLTTDFDQAMEMHEIISMIAGIDIWFILPVFLFYFMFGYLFYSAFFAAVGSASDTETDTQQFMLPITLPLFLSFIMATGIMRAPDSDFAYWFSIIPFTSPVVMMVRLPFGVPTIDLVISMGLLLLGFVAATWFAGRIYRVGILMYGKKPRIAEVLKWFFYKI